MLRVISAQIARSYTLKLGSITFSLPGAGKRAQPKDFISILTSAEVWDMSHGNSFFRIDEWDGNPDNFTGSFRWRIGEGNTPASSRANVERWKAEEMDPFGVTMNIDLGQDENGQFWNITVTQNESQNWEQIPEMNLANDNAQALLQMLGIPFDYDGSIDLATLKQKLDRVHHNMMTEFTQDPSSGRSETGGPMVHEFGRDIAQLKRYVDGLNQMVEYGLREGETEITWY